MNTLDVTQSALLGIDEARRDQINQPTRLICDGCGVAVYVSKPMIEPAKQSAAMRRHKLYIVCRKCAQPFLRRVASGDGVLEGTPDGVSDVMDDVMLRRREFLRSN